MRTCYYGLQIKSEQRVAQFCWELTDRPEFTAHIRSLLRPPRCSHPRRLLAVGQGSVPLCPAVGVRAAVFLMASSTRGCCLVPAPGLTRRLALSQMVTQLRLCVLAEGNADPVCLARNSEEDKVHGSRSCRESPRGCHHVPLPWLPSWEESFPSAALSPCLSFPVGYSTPSGRGHEGSGSQLWMHKAWKELLKTQVLVPTQIPI